MIAAVKLVAYTSYRSTVSPFWLTSKTIANQAAKFQETILLEQSEPKTTIESITIDMNRWFSNQNSQLIDNGSDLFIQHKLDDGNYVKGYFRVAGIKHHITESEWMAEIILRPSEIYTLKTHTIKQPTFTFTANTTPNGDGNYTTATNFTAAINNYTSGDLAKIDKIEWVLNFFADDFGNRFPGSLPSQINQITDETHAPFTGTSVTWNYDNNGTFKNYPNYWGFPLIGPGKYTVWCYVTDKEGFTKVFYVAEPGVIAATAHADFGFTKNSLEEVTFYDLSGADTDTWSWNFGDGTTYNGQNPPTKTYANAGTYNVTLTVNNGYTTNSITKQVTTTVYTLNVKYIRLRFQGTVSAPYIPNGTVFNTDLIDTFGLLELQDTSYAQTGGVQPFHINVRTLDKVHKILESHTGLQNFWMYSSGSGAPFNTSIPPTADNYIQYGGDSDGSTTYTGPVFTTNYGLHNPANPLPTYTVCSYLLLEVLMY